MVLIQSYSITHWNCAFDETDILYWEFQGSWEVLCEQMEISNSNFSFNPMQKKWDHLQDEEKEARKNKKQCKALGIVMTSLWHKREAEINSRFFCICYPNYPHISILHIVKWTNLSKTTQCSHDERIGYCLNIRKRIYNTCFCCQGEILEGNEHILMRLEVKQMWTHRGSRSW